MKLFLQKKCKIFECWGLRPHTPVPPAAGGFVPKPPKQPPPLRVSGYAPAPNSGKIYFSTLTPTPDSGKILFSTLTPTPHKNLWLPRLRLPTPTLQHCFLRCFYPGSTLIFFFFFEFLTMYVARTVLDYIWVINTLFQTSPAEGISNSTKFESRSVLREKLPSFCLLSSNFPSFMVRWLLGVT